MYNKLMACALNAAKKAGEYLLSSNNLVLNSEAGKDIKLSSDVKSERIILECLSETKIPVLSEEIGFLGAPGSRCWIVDPLDGTFNYYKGVGELACVSIALFENGEPVLGVVYRFACDEMFCGLVGVGATRNGCAINPSNVTNTSQAVVAVGFPINRDYSDASLSKFIKQVQIFKKVRMLGAAATMATFVACGRFDAYYEEDIMIWDVAAAMAILKSVGASVDFRPGDNNRCNFKCFSTQALMEDYYAQSL